MTPPPNTIRSQVAYVRGDRIPGQPATIEIDIRMIGVRIPADWAGKKYMPMVVADPNDPSQPVLEFVDVSGLLASGGGGWGIHATYLMGTL